MSDYVTFTIGRRAFATRLGDVREVVRLGPLVRLPGMKAPVAGIIDLRGMSLPVVDVRPIDPGGGDVLVVHGGGEPEFGFVCDAVTSVATAEALPHEAGTLSTSLPDYVDAVLRSPEGAVFLVDLRRMTGAGAIAELPHVAAAAESSAPEPAA